MLRVNLFGELELRIGEHSLPRLPTQKSKALLALLALNRGRPQRREVVASTLWSERSEAEARKYLRNELWRVRAILEPVGVAEGSYLVARGDQIGFNPDAQCWFDVADFESTVAAARRQGRLADRAERSQLLSQAIGLYRGDLLEGLDEDWCIYERERLRTLFLSTLEDLVQQHLAEQDWARAIELGQRLLAQDPLLENVHRDLMRCYYRLGNRAAALRQFEVCAEVLRRELDVEPGEETLELYRLLRNGGGEGMGVLLAPQLAQRESPQIQEAIAELNAAQVQVELATAGMWRAIGKLRHLLDSR